MSIPLVLLVLYHGRARKRVLATAEEEIFHHRRVPDEIVIPRIIIAKTVEEMKSDPFEI